MGTKSFQSLFLALVSASNPDEAAHSMSALFHSQGFEAGFLRHFTPVHVCIDGTAPPCRLKLHSHPKTVGGIRLFVAQGWVAFESQIDPKRRIDALVIGIPNACGR